MSHLKCVLVLPFYFQVIYLSLPECIENMRYIVLLPMPPVSQSASLPMFSRCLSHSMFAACTCSFCFITKLSAESCLQPESFLQPGWPVHLTSPTKMFQSSKSPKTSRVQIPFQQQLSRTIVYLPSQCLPSIGFHSECRSIDWAWRVLLSAWVGVSCSQEWRKSPRLTFGPRSAS